MYILYIHSYILLESYGKIKVARQPLAQCVNTSRGVVMRWDEVALSRIQLDRPPTSRCPTDTQPRTLWPTQLN